MKVLLRDILSYINCEVEGVINPNFEINNLLFDSRRFNYADGTIFFAIKTGSNNGEKYIKELYEKGIRIFVCQNRVDKNLFPQATFLIVNDTIEALQAFARFKRKMFDNQVLAITGSNGKTIIKDWIIQLIASERKTCYSPRSFNSQIGVALSVWNIQEKDEVCVFEAGISQKGEMDKLESIIYPTIGLFTNIGDAHQANFSSLEEKIKEKLLLFKHCKAIIYSCNDKLVSQIISSTYKDKELISCGTSKDSTFRITEVIKNDNNTTSISYLYNNQNDSFCIPFIDKTSIENAIEAFVSCLQLGISSFNLKQRTIKLQSLQMRLQMKEGINNTLIINDSYSSDIMSLEAGLNFLNLQKQELDKIVILSDITQSFINEKDLYLTINKLLLSNKIVKLIGIGQGFELNKDLIEIDKEIYLSTDDFLKKCSLKNFRDQIILIKGARCFEFEKIGRFFEKKAHETLLEINLTAIAHNANYFKSKLNEGVMLMAMVKAQSYGCGGYEIASLLASQNIDYLAVAFADEGVELRNKNIQLPIMVMSPEKESISNIIHYNLEPEIYSINILNELIIAKKQYAIIGNDKTLYIHIKLDTGMHRLGMQKNDLTPLINILKSNPEIKIKSIFSHLATSDNPELDFFTLEQIDKFKQMSDKILEEFDYKILRHICNSAAITRFPEAHFDMVRLGIGMYGIGVNSDEQQNLRYVHKLKTNITQIRTIEALESVGYNRNFIAKESRKVGVIPIGYADGLDRKRGNERGKVMVNGCLAPIIGNICMDMCMIDLTGIECSERDDVILFGEEYTVDNIAKELDTIPYEVFTSISTRVKRVFYSE